MFICVFEPEFRDFFGFPELNYWEYVGLNLLRFWFWFCTYASFWGLICSLLKYFHLTLHVGWKSHTWSGRLGNLKKAGEK